MEPNFYYDFNRIYGSEYTKDLMKKNIKMMAESIDRQYKHIYHFKDECTKKFLEFSIKGPYEKYIIQSKILFEMIKIENHDDLKYYISQYEDLYKFFKNMNDFFIINYNIINENNKESSKRYNGSF